MQKCNDAGLNIIRLCEGLRTKAYVAPEGKLTIGYGHTGPDVKQGMVISEDSAEAMLQHDVAKFETIVSSAVRVALTSNQFSALVSFVFNVGPGYPGGKSGFVSLTNGQPSTMLKLINAGQFAMAANEFPKWDRVNGAEFEGLKARRLLERNLFLKPDGDGNEEAA